MQSHWYNILYAVKNKDEHWRASEVNLSKLMINKKSAGGDW